MAKLVFPVGIPGSGKSTWAKTILGQSYHIVSSDDIRRELWGTLRAAHDVTPEEKKRRNKKVWDIFHTRLGDNLEFGVDMYADGTNLHSHARSRLRATAQLTGAELHVIVFDNVGEAWLRNLRRDHDLIVPEDVMMNFTEVFSTAKREVLRGRELDWYESVTIIGSLQ